MDSEVENHSRQEECVGRHVDWIETSSPKQVLVVRHACLRGQTCLHMPVHAVVAGAWSQKIDARVRRAGSRWARTWRARGDNERVLVSRQPSKMLLLTPPRHLRLSCDPTSRQDRPAVNPRVWEGGDGDAASRGLRTICRRPSTIIWPHVQLQPILIRTLRVWLPWRKQSPGCVGGSRDGEWRGKTL